MLAGLPSHQRARHQVLHQDFQQPQDANSVIHRQLVRGGWWVGVPFVVVPVSGGRMMGPWHGTCLCLSLLSSECVALGCTRHNTPRRNAPRDTHRACLQLVHDLTSAGLPRLAFRSFRTKWWRAYARTPPTLRSWKARATMEPCN